MTEEEDDRGRRDWSVKKGEEEEIGQKKKRGSRYRQDREDN